MKLLIDADVLAYSMSFANQEALEVEPGYWTWYVDYNKVLNSIEDRLAWLLEHLKADDYVLCLSDTRNFRADLAGTYKGKRSNLRRPIVLKKVREEFLARGAIMYPNLEGDDVMGFLAGEDTIIVSIDKDMKTIPGKYYKDSVEGIQEITEEMADYNHLYQTLIGDTIDGYSGCPGIGPVKAREALDKDPSWETVVKLFEKKKLTEEDALLQARLARILRKDDYNPETGEIKLWTPERGNE